VNQGEKAFQGTLVDALTLRRYVVDHTYPLRTRDGWRTGSTLKGKPDLIALRPPWELAIEVKFEDGTLAEEQRAVLSLYAQLPHARAWVIRSTMPFEMVVGWITDPAEAPRVHGFQPMTRARAVEVIELSRLRRQRSRPGSRTVPSGQLQLGKDGT
jgi:hypothetical protein